jgi:hypothetical protein
MADYFILVKTVLDAAGLQEQLNAFVSKMKPLDLKATIGLDASKLQQTINSAVKGAKIPRVPVEITVDDAQVQAKIDSIMKNFKPQTQYFTNQAGEVNRIVETYNKGMGEVVTVTKFWVEETEDVEAHWAATVKYMDQAQISAKVTEQSLAKQASIQQAERAKELEQNILIEQYLEKETVLRAQQITATSEQQSKAIARALEEDLRLGQQQTLREAREADAINKQNMMIEQSIDKQDAQRIESEEKLTLVRSNAIQKALDEDLKLGKAQEARDISEEERIRKQNLEIEQSIIKQDEMKRIAAQKVLDTYDGLMLKLEALKIKNKDAFNAPSVKQQETEFLAMANAYKTGTGRVEEANMAFKK